MTQQFTTTGKRDIMKEIVFYYDVVCPFAYMASRLIEGVARRNGAKILWKPVLLGKCQLSVSCTNKYSYKVLKREKVMT